MIIMDNGVATCKPVRAHTYEAIRPVHCNNRYNKNVDEECNTNVSKNTRMLVRQWLCGRGDE